MYELYEINGHIMPGSLVGKGNTGTDYVTIAETDTHPCTFIPVILGLGGQDKACPLKGCHGIQRLGTNSLSTFSRHGTTLISGVLYPGKSNFSKSFAF